MMKIIKRIIAVVLVMALFCISFIGSYSYFNKGTFEFDAEKLAIFDENEECYFLRQVPSDIKFQIKLSEGEKILHTV